VNVIVRSADGWPSRALLLLVALALVTAGGSFTARADELSEIAFSEGLVALKADDLDRARAQFEAATARDPADSPAWYWLGIARARAGDQAGAVAAFDEALALDPGFAQASYARGNALYRQGDEEGARRAWNRAVESAPGTEVARRAKRQLEGAAPEGEPEAMARDWALRAGLGVEYDTNVFLFPNRGDAGDAQSGLMFRAPDYRYDTRFVYYVDGSYRLVNRPNWSLRLRQALQAVSQVRSEDVNYVSYTPSLSLDYTKGRLSLGMDYSFDLFGLAGGLFLLRHRVEPSLTLREGDCFFTRLSYRYSYSDFPDVASRTFDRTGHDHRVGLDQYLLLFNRRGYARAGVEGRRELTRGSEYDARYLTVRGELAAPLPGEARIRLEGEQRWGDYDHDSAFSRPREVFFVMGPTFAQVIQGVKTGDPKRESQTVLGATISRDFGEHWIGSVRYTHTVNESSIDAFDYSREIFSLFAIYSF
jgi:tetratricopeptide (TPR) repeat protein